MRKPDKPTGEETADAVATLMGDFFKSYPLIWEFISCSKWDDGTARETGQLAIGIHEGELRLSLNDRELKQSMYTACSDVVEGLDMMESALQSDGVRWYKWNRGKKVK